MSDPAMNPTPPARIALPPCVESTAAPREVLLEELLHGDRELLIRHGAEVYHLRVTKNGRLLLTK